jgi:F-type H+-transporting ATPase subunit a
MGEESSWFDLFGGLKNIEEVLRHQFSRTEIAVQAFPSQWTMTHVWSVALVLTFVTIGAIKYAMTVGRGGEAAIVPPSKFGLRNLFEMFTDAVLNVAEGVMGEVNAKKYLPLIGTLAFFIFFSNCLALIPGFAPPTATLKTNVALAITVFVLTHVFGVWSNGLGYFKHFLGPKLFLAPLMLPIEIVSNVARPLSLSLRLLGNMAADHKVVSAFFALVPLLVPVPFMVLGVLVCIIQTLVFCLLSMVYIQGAIAHHEGEHDEVDHVHHPEPAGSN